VFAGLAPDHDAIWLLQRHGDSHGAVEIGSLNCGTTLSKALKGFGSGVAIRVLHPNRHNRDPWIKHV
jgi:hypothetical protein